jgi:hypothetical protein
MSCLRLLLLIALASSAVLAQQLGWTPAQPLPDSCPIVKRPIVPYIPPPPFDKEKLSDSSFWFGSDRLFKVLNDTMISEWEPRASGHENDEYPRNVKLFFYSAGYNPWLDGSPKLTVTARRLDGPAPNLLISRASNALGEEGTGAMVTAFYVPTPGCWEITGHYKDESLSFVVWFTPMRKVPTTKPASAQPGQH